MIELKLNLGGQKKLLLVVSTVSVSAQEDVDEEEAIFSLCDFLAEKDEDIFCDSIAAVKGFRDTTWKIAGENIITEQMKQKRQYDKK